VPLQHAGQSAPLFVDRIVPDALQFQLIINRPDSVPLALAPCPSQQLESASAGSGLTGGIDRGIFCESPAGICDSIPAWPSPAKTCRKILTRCGRR
jgi:hypothetical protein